MAMSTKAITVAEYGRAVEYSRESQLLAQFDPEDMIQNRLRAQMKLVLDTVVFAAFKGCKIRYAPTSDSGGTFTTDAGVTSSVATNNVRVAHIKILRDYLDDTIHTEPYEGDTFMALASVKALRGVKDDPEWMGWRQYIQPEQAFFRGEVGMIEDVRFVKVNHTPALSGSKGTGSVLGEMLVFGKDAVAMAEVETPQLLAAIPGDFGRQKAVAWLGMLAFGEVWDTASDGEARILYVTSS
jgi:N4-gp56 family major capsid protein